MVRKRPAWAQRDRGHSKRGGADAPRLRLLRRGRTDRCHGPISVDPGRGAEAAEGRAFGPFLPLRTERDAPELPRAAAHLWAGCLAEKAMDALEPVAPNDPVHVRHLAPLEHPREHEVNVAINVDGI